MRRPIIALLLLCGGCHAHQVASEHRSIAEEPPKAREVSSGRPVRTTPGGFLDPASVRKIQVALSEKGEAVKSSGRLDDETQAAIKRFQAKQQQPTTGFPDFGTLKLLGLDARDIYLNGAKRRGEDPKNE
ncbi:MAG: peptidoglycan-binding domain-containing protein [Polyangia bacterium]